LKEEKKDTGARVEIMVKTALMTALVCVVTIMIPIPIPFTNGYIHPGDSMIFLGVLLLGWKNGAIAAGLGSAVADFVLGYVYYAPFTFVIKGGMALIMGLILAKCISGKALAAGVAGIATAWVAFNLIVRLFISSRIASGKTELINMAIDSESISDPSQFTGFINGFQSRIMIAAILIPVLLIVIALIMRKNTKFRVSLHQIVAMTGAGIFMVFGYYIAGGLLMGGNATAFAISAFSMPANIVQFTFGFIVASLLSAALRRTPLKFVY
jgi:uncharacterized membrane protein